MARPLTPRAAPAEPRSYQWSAFATGFFLQFDLVPTAWHIPITRISLVIMLPWIAFLVHRLLSRTNLLWTILYGVLMLIFVLLHLAFSGTSLNFGGGNVELAVSLSYALYLLGGIGLYIALAQRSGTGSFCWGLLIGALVSLIVFVMQAAGLGSLAIALGLSQPRQVIQELGGSGFSRLTGMWGHANAVGHILAIAAPAAGYLFIARRDRLPLILLAVIMGTCFFFTANRGGMIAAVLTCIAMLFMRKESVMAQRRTFLIAIGGLVGISYAMYFLPSPEFIYVRFTEDSGINSNASGRVATTLSGIELAIRHPFGLSSTDWRASLKENTGFITPHNGFITLAYQMGLPFLLMYLAAIVGCVLAGLRKPRKLSLDIFLMLAAVQASISFMFEELSNADPFIVLIGLIMARCYSAAVDVNGRRRTRVEPRRQPDNGREPAPLTQAPLDQGA
jgi:O-antigen ligase